DSVLHEQVADTIAPVDERRMNDEAPVEIDLAEAAPVRDRQATGLPPQGEELKHVGETRLPQASANRHQRGLSARRASTSVQSRITLPGLRNHGSCAASGAGVAGRGLDRPAVAAAAPLARASNSSARARSAGSSSV